MPSHAIGRTIGERIALDGTNWLNLRFVTPLDIALPMGAPFLVERGLNPSEEGLGPALIMRLLLDLPEEGGYFRPLADQPTMAQALWATIRELRAAGITAEDLKSDAFASSAKHAELRALLGAYEQFLATTNRGDMALVYEEAVKHLDWCPIQPQDCWTELPDTSWNPLQRRLMDAMPGERIAPQALELPGVSVPRRLSGSARLQAGRDGSVRLQPDPVANPLAFLMHPPAPDSGSRTPDPGTRSIALFHAGGREAEVEEVIRRILSAGVPLDQVEIACASDAHVALVWEKALRHDWAVTLGPGIPATQTRPGRAVIGFCDWIETDFSAGHRTSDNGQRATKSVSSDVAEGRAPSPRVPSPRAPASITFSYSCRDTREFRETYASWLMLQAFRLQQGDASCSYQRMKAALGEPKSIVFRDRSAASSSGGWWLRSVVGTGTDGADAVGSTFAGLARGQNAILQRLSDADDIGAAQRFAANMAVREESVPCLPDPSDSET